MLKLPRLRRVIVLAAATVALASGTALANAAAAQAHSDPTPQTHTTTAPSAIRMPTATYVGDFRLKNYGWGNYCLAITGGAGARTALQACATSGQAYLNQAWRIYPAGSDGQGGTWYTAVNLANGLCLDGDPNNLTGGAAVRTSYCNGHTNQEWGFAMNLNYTQHVSNLAAYEYPLNDRFLLDMTSNLQRLWSYTGSANQYWSWIV